jgi:hypothetical protein
MAHPKSRPPDPSSRLFADTVYWIGLVRERDEHRGPVLLWQEWVESRQAKLITTLAVLWECLNGCSHPQLRSRAAALYRLCEADESVEIVGFSPKRMMAARAFYEDRPDKEWSLTDCFSFVVMRDRRRTDALTTDHHFVQAGFRALLLENPPI